MDQAVSKVAYVMPASDELLADAEAIRDAFREWMDATPERRERWAREAAGRRATEREASTVAALSLDALLGKLNFTEQYAAHLVQPYCTCGDGLDGWDYCEHARDLGLVP